MAPSVNLMATTGELRPELLRALDVDGSIDILCGPPGLLAESYLGLASLARAPGDRPPISTTANYRTALLADLGRSLDRLPQTHEWEGLIRRWISRLALADARVWLAQRDPVFPRVVSRTERTVLLTAPVGVEGELKFELTGGAHNEVRAWCIDRIERAADISRDVLAVLRQSWAGALLTPEEMYLKILYEYFASTLTGLDRETDPNPMLEWLTDFQLEAYHFAKGILRRHGGVFLADVVGLGKTYIAMALLRHLHDRYGHDAVVIAPPAVMPAWEQLAAEHRVPLQIVSIGKLEDLDKFGDREVLVIDESHNFRNATTRRHEVINQWLRPRGEPSAKQVLLLSATPQNNDAKDVLHQLRFFPDNYARLPFRGENLDEWFQSVRGQPQELAKLLQHVVVRRTRTFIKAAYPKATLRVPLPGGGHASKPLAFPKRVSGAEQTLRYVLDGRADGSHIYDRTMSGLERMHYPLHGLGLYVTESHREHKAVANLRRSGPGLRGLYKVLLLKRLESSLFAFSRSIDRLQARLDAAIVALQQGRVLAHGDEVVEEEDDGAATTVPPFIDAALFDKRLLLMHLQEDRATVQRMKDDVEFLALDDDPKLDRLVQWLTARPPREHRTIVFTQFTDTATYIAEHLGQRFGRTETASGSSPRRFVLTRRFSPRSNRADVASEDEIDLLVSTDALSEGVNLQDADTLINFDIHWNPVRLIQRAGRIDRIGSENEEIMIASFLPERGLERNLGIEQVLRRRIDEFLQVFGEDSRVLPSDDAPDVDQMVSAYTGAALEDSDAGDDMDALSRHVNRILALRRDDPARFETIAQLRAGRRSASVLPRPGAAATRVGWYWRFWQADSRGGVSPLDDIAGLDEFYEHAGAGAAAEEPADLGDLAEQARAAFEAEAQTFIGQRSHPRLSAAEDWVFQRLSDYMVVCIPTQRELVEALQRWVTTGQAKAVLQREARVWKKQNLAAAPVFHELRSLVGRFPGSDEPLGEPEFVGLVVGRTGAR